MAPEPKSLASIVTNMLCCGMREALMVVRQWGDVARRLILSKACWCFSVHGGNSLLQSFVVSVLRMCVCVARSGRKADRYRTSPRKPWTCLAEVGMGQSRMRSVFPSSASTPLAEMQCPRNRMSVQNNLVFAGLQYNLFFCKVVRIVATFVQCSLMVRDQMTMSLR